MSELPDFDVTELAGYLPDGAEARALTRQRDGKPIINVTKGADWQVAIELPATPLDVAKQAHIQEMHHQHRLRVAPERDAFMATIRALETQMQAEINAGLADLDRRWEETH